jgi:hypothetical protein
MQYTIKNDISSTLRMRRNQIREGPWKKEILFVSRKSAAQRHVFENKDAGISGRFL